MRFLRGTNSHPAWVVVAVLLIIVGPFIALLTPAFLTVSTFQYSSRISYIPLPVSITYYIWAFVLFSVGTGSHLFYFKKVFKNHFWNSCFCFVCIFILYWGK